jgi:cardiolipin synthase
MVNANSHSDSTESRWLTSGAEGYRQMLDAIDRAGKSVRMESYIFRATGPGERFRAALVRAARRGVRVEVLLDGYGSSELPEDYWGELLGSGGAVRIFNPISFRLFSIRNHRKLMLVDDEAAWVGGFNIGPEYEGDGVTQGWRDLGVELRQPSALRDLAETFDALFQNHHLHGRPLQRFRRAVAGPATLRASPHRAAQRPALGPQ